MTGSIVEHRTARRVASVVALVAFATTAFVVTGGSAYATPPTPVTFAQPVVYGPANVGSVDLADVNVDSKLDAVAGGNVWLGNGSGGFGPAIHPSTAGDDNRIVDVNHDPFPDRAGIDSDADVVSVQLGDGTGQFGAVTQYSTGLAPIDLAVADVNGDLFTDLVTANLTGSVTVLLGSEAGTYSTQDFPTFRGPRSLGIGDVNGDTLPDIVVGGFVYDLVGWHTAVLLGDGTGSFGSSTVVSDQLPVNSLQLADLNADGALDVVASADIFYGGPSLPGGGNPRVALGHGDGSFSSYVTYPVSVGCPCALTAADLNGDTIPDLAVAGQGTSSTPSGVAVLLGNGDGTFASATTYLGGRPGQVAVGDVNGDGRADMVAGAPAGLVVFINTPGLPFAPVITAVRGDLGSVTVSWTAPLTNGGPPITAYTVSAFQSGDLPVASATFDSAATTQTLTGLTNGQSYRLRVAATNAVGTGTYSDLSVDVGVGNVPGAPPTVAAYAGNGGAGVTWTVPASGTFPITGYEVTPYVGYFALPSTTFNSTATSQLISGLTNGTTYRFKVAAISLVGTGAMSTVSNPVTPFAPTVPGPPTIGIATAHNGSATLSWSAPSSDGGAGITSYVVTPFIDGTPQSPYQFSSSVTTQLIVFLTNGVTYTFTVAAVNAVGTGAMSAHSNPVTPVPNPPRAPTFVSASAGDGQATVSWTAPTRDGGSPITGYEVTPYIGVTAQTPTIFNSTTTTQTITLLTNGTTYTFRVAAINAVGTGPMSAESNPVTPFAPAAPEAPTIGTATAGNGQATVSWTAPTSDGGSPITAYEVTPYIGFAAQTPTTFNSTATTQTITMLTNGTTYRFRVRAINAVGFSGYSKVTNPVTPTA